MTSSAGPARRSVAGSQLRVGQRVRVGYADTSKVAGIRGSIVGLGDEYVVIRSEKSGKDVHVGFDNIAAVEQLPASATPPSRDPDFQMTAMRPWIAPASLALNAITVLLLLVVIGSSGGSAVENEVSDVQLSMSTLQSDVDSLRSDMADLASGISDLQDGVTIRTEPAPVGQKDPIQERFDQIESQLDAIQQTVRRICQNSSGTPFAIC